MKPQLEIFGRLISTYALFSVIGILLALWIFCLLLNKRGVPDSQGFYLVLIGSGGAFLGSHILYMITRLGDITQIFKSTNAIIAVADILGGSVFYGGLLGGIIAGGIYLKSAKLDFRAYTDAIAVVIPFFHAFARVGCFFAGCCYGKESTVGFLIKENFLIPSVVGVRRFPVQLLEATFNILLFVALILIYFRSLKKEKLRVGLFPIYLLCYSIIRFFIEFLRGDTVRGIWWGLSTSQWISVGIFIVVIIGVIIDCRKRKI